MAQSGKVAFDDVFVRSEAQSKECLNEFPQLIIRVRIGQGCVGVGDELIGRWKDRTDLLDPARSETGNDLR